MVSRTLGVKNIIPPEGVRFQMSITVPLKGVLSRVWKLTIYLLKQIEVLKQWHRRYFVLSKKCLCYYRNEKDSLEDAPKEVIFFNDMSLYIDVLPDKQTKYCLRIVKRSLLSKIAARTFLLCCSSEVERNEWLTQILQAKAITINWLVLIILVQNLLTRRAAVNYSLRDTEGSSAI